MQFCLLRTQHAVSLPEGSVVCVIWVAYLCFIGHPYCRDTACRVRCRRWYPLGLVGFASCNFVFCGHSTLCPLPDGPIARVVWGDCPCHMVDCPCCMEHPRDYPYCRDTARRVRCCRWYPLGTVWFGLLRTQHAVSLPNGSIVRVVWGDRPSIKRHVGADQVVKKKSPCGLPAAGTPLLCQKQRLIAAGR